MTNLGDEPALEVPDMLNITAGTRFLQTKFFVGSNGTVKNQSK